MPLFEVFGRIYLLSMGLHTAKSSPEISFWEKRPIT
jgi:hypothetical protein